MKNKMEKCEVIALKYLYEKILILAILRHENCEKYNMLILSHI